MYFATFEANVAKLYGLSMEEKKLTKTAVQYDNIINQCREIFTKKTQDYGTAWRVLRTISIVDQVYIKAQRIRTIQEKGHQKIDDDISGEFIGIINYSVIGLIQMHLAQDAPEELDVTHATALYTAHLKAAKELMMNKNHDYGEAWRSMSQESFADLILMKLQRMKQILTNKGQTIISEGIDANYFDMINYGIFALILMDKNL